MARDVPRAVSSSESMCGVDDKERIEDQDVTYAPIEATATVLDRENIARLRHEGPTIKCSLRTDRSIRETMPKCLRGCVMSVLRSSASRILG